MTSEPIARYLAQRGHQLQRRERLRPMSPSELFNASLRLYRQLAWTFLKLTVVPTTFCLAGVVFVLQNVMPSLFETHHVSSTSGQLGEAAAAMAIALVVGGPLFLIGLSYICSIVIALASSNLLGQTISEHEAVEQARRSLAPLIIVALRELLWALIGVAAGALVLGLGALLSAGKGESSLGALVFTIGVAGLCIGFGWFVYVMSVHSLAPAVVQLEGLKATEAARRSARLLRSQGVHPGGTGNLLSCMVYLAIIGAIEWSGLQLIDSLLQAANHEQALISGIPFEGVVAFAFSLLPIFVTVWTLLPIYATCVTLVYYERRIRLEGLDIEILASETQRSSAPNRFDV